MIKSYKIRLFPTKEQEAILRNHIGACRYIWNYMLGVQNERYANGEKYLSAFDMINLLKPLKNDDEHGWLNEVSNQSLCRICRDLHEAYQQMFKKTSHHPKFKSKRKSKQAYPVRDSGNSLWFDDGRFAHIEKVGKVKFKTDFDLPIGRGNKFSNPRIIYKLGKWILSFGMECENQTPILTDKLMGIDLGVKDSAIVAFGDDHIVFPNINKSRQMRMLNKKIKHTQRAISRKYEANRQGKIYFKTNNIIRLENKLRRLYERKTNIRNNFIHQSTHKIVSMRPRRITMEDLDIKRMLKDKSRAHDIQDQCWYEWIRQLRYKSEWNGIEFVQADRYYGSSKTCSGCGYYKHDLKSNDRIYICPECGLVIDRDYNAALNLQRYAA